MASAGEDTPAVNSVQPGDLDGEEAAPLNASLEELRAELEAIHAENLELQQYAEQALQQAEHLKHENEELRKLSEDAVLDQQLVKALNETEKLQVAANAYKKDLLQQKLGERDIQLQQAQERLQAAERQLASMSSTLTEVRNANQATAAELEHVRRENARLRELPGADGPDGQAQLEARSSVGHEDLAAQLAQAKPGSVDQALLVAAAAAVKETAGLERQLRRAQEENERLTKDVKELHDTVFSKGFRAPSAWAEREVKYKMEKRDWEAQVARLKKDMDALSCENAAYRDSNKTAEFEARIQELTASVKKVEAERTVAQQEAHALQLQLRQVPTTLHRTPSGRWGADDARSEDGVHHIIEELEGAGLGVQQPRQRPIKTPARALHQGGVPGETPVSAASSQDLGPMTRDGNMQDMIQDYDDARIGYSGPNAQARAAHRRRGRDGLQPDAFSSDPNHDALDFDGVGHLRDSYDGGSPPRYASPQRGAHRSARKPSRLADVGSASRDEEEGVGMGMDERMAMYLEQGGVRQPSAQMRPSTEQPGGAQAPFGEAAEEWDAADYRINAESCLQGGPPAADAPGPSSREPGANRQADVRGGTEPYSSEGGARLLLPVEQASGEAAQAPGPSREMHADREADVRGGSEPYSSDGTGQLQLPVEVAGVQGEPASTLQTGWSPPPPPGSQNESDVHAEEGAVRSGVEGLDASGAGSELGGPPSAAELGTADHEGGSGDASQAAPSQVVSTPDGVSVTVSKGDVLRLDSRAAQDQRGVLQQAEPSQAEGRTHARGDPFMETVDLEGGASGDDVASASGSDDAAVAAETASQSGRMVGPEAAGRERPRRQLASSGGGGGDALDAFLEITPVDEVAGGVVPNRPAENGQAAHHVSRPSVESVPESPWTEEQRAALAADKQEAETQWGSHVTEQDVGTLRWRTAEMETRVQIAEAQLQKMQRALERADQDKARLEQDLATLVASKGTDLKDAPSSLRDRLRRVVSLQPTATDRLQETEAVLRQSAREREALQRSREALMRQLQGIAAKLGAGQIPEPAELELPPETLPGMRSLRHMNSWVAGLTDEEVEVSRMQEENATMMETLVRTKVELAETQGDYLKMRRALIRSVEKQADLADRMESLKAAFQEGDMAGVAGVMAQGPLSRAHNGDIESLGERNMY